MKIVNIGCCMEGWNRDPNKKRELVNGYARNNLVCKGRNLERLDFKNGGMQRISRTLFKLKTISGYRRETFQINKKIFKF